MPGRGPESLTPGERRRRGTEPARDEPPPPPEVITAIRPRAPRRLSVQAKVHWRRAMVTVTGAGVDARMYVRMFEDPLERYCELAALASEATQKLQDSGISFHTKDTRGNNTTKPHPEASVLNQLNAELRQLGAQLCLVPAMLPRLQAALPRAVRSGLDESAGLLNI